MRRVFSLHLFLCSVLSPCLFAFPQSLSLALCVPGFLTLVLCLPSRVCLLPPLPCILSVCVSVCVLDFLFYFDSHSACVHYVQFCFTCVIVNLRSSVSGSSKNVASVKMQMLYWTVAFVLGSLNYLKIPGETKEEVEMERCLGFF